MSELTIYFIRKDKTYPISGISKYSPSKIMIKNTFNLYAWILKEHNNINVLLTKPNQVLFNNIKRFCESNDLNYRLPLHLFAYIDNKDLYIEIEQGSIKECINFDNSIYAKITCEHNLKRLLSSEELNNLFTSEYIFKK